MNRVEVKAEPIKPVARNNPYKVGSACYIAYESGYTDALEDMKKLMDPKNMKMTIIGTTEEWKQ